jgi:hypothetical protein
MGALPVFGEQTTMAAHNDNKWTVLRLGFVGTTLLLARFLLPVPEQPAQPALLATIYACTALLAMLVFEPREGVGPSGPLRWSLAVTALLAILLVCDPITISLRMLVLRLGITFFLLAITISLATRRLAMPPKFALVALLTLLPVWAAPLIELAGNPDMPTNAVVTLSPLTVFATAVDLDILRTNWFYANSALGSLRYAYPAWPNVCLVLSIVPVAALLAELARRHGIHRSQFAKEARQ